MRRRLAAVVLFAFATFAPGASATLLLPPSSSSPYAQSVKPFTMASPTQLRVAHTCMIRSKLARRLVPVACEQPPRSQVLLATLIAF
jgi:hypothetical protein